MSPHEETVTKTNQENGLLDSPKREDEITAEPYQGEKCATFDKQSDEIQREEVRIRETRMLYVILPISYLFIISKLCLLYSCLTSKLQQRQQA